MSFFRRKASPAARTDQTDGAADAAEARSRARRRLIGAVFLLGAGVIAFPLLFETEPRPIPVDLPIEIPRKDGLPALAVPAPNPARAASARVTEAPPLVATSPAVVPAPPPAEEPPPASAAVSAKQPEPDRKPAAVAPAPAAPPDDGARAKALLEAKPAAAAPATAQRFVVQIGAFAEDRTVRDVRAKVEKLGMVTYTQVIQVQAGERTRVRVGPFPKREDADATAEKLKKAGLPASVLTL